MFDYSYKMEKYPSLSSAKVDVALERLDKQMSQVYHTEILKKFSHEAHSDGICTEKFSQHTFQCHSNTFSSEMVFPSVLHQLKDQRSHVFHMADSMGMNISTTMYA